MIRARQLAGASVSLGSVTLWLGLLGLITTPYLIHQLGASVYGVFALITIISAYLLNLELGFGHATARFLARARAAGDEAEERAVVGTGFAVFLVAGLTAVAIALGASEWIVRTFVNGPTGLGDQALDAVRIGAFILLASFLSSFAAASLQALGRFNVVLGTRLIFGTLLSGGAVLTVALGGGLVAVLITQAAVSAGLCTVLCYSLVRATGAPLHPRIQRSTLRAMAGFGGLVLLASLFYQAMLQGPPTVLAGNSTTDQVAAFAVPSLVLQQLVVLATATSFGFFPFVSARSVEPDRSGIASVFLANLRLTLLIIGPIAAFLILFARPLLSAWIGGDFAGDAIGPLQFLAGAAVFLALSSAPADVARGLGHPGWIARFTAVAAAVSIGGSFAAVGAHGAAGVSAALLAGLSIGTVPFVVIVAQRLLELSAGEVASALAGPALAVGLCGGTFAIGAAISPNLAGAVVTGALATPAYAGIALALVLDDRERRELLAGIGARLPRLRLRDATR